MVSVPLNIHKTDNHFIICESRQDNVTQFFLWTLNGETFLRYIQEDLASSLHPGDFVIKHNLICHKVDNVKEAIESARELLFYTFPLMALTSTLLK